MATFTNQDLELNRLNLDLRMEQIRQSSSQYNFDHFQSILKRNLKDKKLVTDVDIHADLQKATDLLRDNSAERELGSTCNLSEALRRLASNLELTIDAQSDAFELKGDRFQMSVILDPESKEISGCYVNYAFDDEEKEPDLIKRLLEEKKIDELSDALQKMIELIPSSIQINHTELKSGNTHMVLRVLESDLVEIKKRGETLGENDIDQYALEFLFTRSDLLPTTFVLLAEPFLGDTVRKLNEHNLFIDFDKVLYSAYLCLKKTGVLYDFPARSFLDERGNWIDKFDPIRLPVEYCLCFQRPILLSRENYNEISSFEGVTSLNVLGQTNLFRHLSGVSYQDKLNLRCQVSPEFSQSYNFPECDNRNGDAVVINEIHFIHPRKLTTILQIIRDQLLFNVLFESLCRRSSVKQIGVGQTLTSAYCQISAPNSSGFAVQCRLKNDAIISVTLSIANGTIKASVSSEPATILMHATNQIWDEAITSTFSIPLLMHLVISQVHEGLCTLEDGTKLEEPSEEENEYGFLENNSVVDDNVMSSDCSFSNTGKSGNSWLRIEQKMHTNSIHNSFGHFARNRNRSRRVHTYQVLREKDGNTLLRAAKNVTIVKELIPPVAIAPPHYPAPLRQMPAMQIGHGARGLAGHDGAHPRPVRTSTDTAAIFSSANAFSDLEAIAEMGAADDTESVLSERSNISASMAIDNNCSPSAVGSGTVTSAISPIEQQRQHANLMRRRFMQQQSGQSHISQQNAEVFDFRTEDSLQSPSSYNMSAPGTSFDDYSGFTPISLSGSTPYTPSATGRRRGRARKVGNSGDRMPSMDGDVPESPSGMEYAMWAQTGNGRKPRGAGTPTTRRPRKPRKPSNVGLDSNYIIPFSESDRPTLQRSFSKVSASYVSSPSEESRMMYELEMLQDSSDEETDPPPAPRNLELNQSADVQTAKKQTPKQSIVKQEAGVSEQFTANSPSGQMHHSTTALSTTGPTLQKMSSISSSGHSSSSTTATPSPQENPPKMPLAHTSIKVELEEKDHLAKPSMAQKQAKVKIEDSASSSGGSSPETKKTKLARSGNATNKRKPSLQPQTKPIEKSIEKIDYKTPPALSMETDYFDLYDNELDSAPKIQPEQRLSSHKESSPKVSKERQKPKDVSRSKERSKDTHTNKELPSSTLSRKRKQKDPKTGDDTLKVVLKLPKSKGGEGGISRESGTKHETKYSSSSSSPSSSCSSSLTQASHATLSTTEPIQRLSSHAAPPSKSKSSLPSRHIDSQTHRLPTLKRKPSEFERGESERKKKMRKETPSWLSSALKSTSSSLSKELSSTSKEPLKSKKASTTAPPPTTPAQIFPEYSSLVKSAPKPAGFTSLKNFRIPKVVEAESSSTKQEQSSAKKEEPKETKAEPTKVEQNSRAEPTSKSNQQNEPADKDMRPLFAQMSAASNTSTTTHLRPYGPPDPEFLNRKPSKSILKNSTSHTYGGDIGRVSQQQGMPPSSHRSYGQSSYGQRIDHGSSRLSEPLPPQQNRKFQQANSIDKSRVPLNRPLPANIYSRERTGVLGWNTGYSTGGHNVKVVQGEGWPSGGQSSHSHQAASSESPASPINDPDSVGRDNSPTEGLRIDEDE